MNHHVIAYSGAMKPAPNCAANDSELGPCERSCGRTICLMRADCVRPVVEVKRTLWQRWLRHRRIHNAHENIVHLERIYRHVQADKRTKPGELRRERLRLEVARVDLALALR